MMSAKPISIRVIMREKQTKNKIVRRPLDGILLLDKPMDVTSNRILQHVRRLFQAEKAGHSGTLDPMATGLLPIAFGEATKFSSQLLDSHKSYEFICALGEKTSTGDKEGEVVETQTIPPLSEPLLTDALTALTGDILQTPPMVSALHHNGKRLYELAREGIEVPREPRPVTILSLELIGFDSHSFHAKVTCSKGTYVRVLAEDIVAKLGTLGHLTMLRRTAIYPFMNPNMVSLETLEAADSLEALDRLLLPIDSALIDLPKWEFTEEESARVLHGQRIRVETELTEPLYRLYDHNQLFLGVGAPNTPFSIGAKRIIQRRE